MRRRAWPVVTALLAAAALASFAVAAARDWRAATVPFVVRQVGPHSFYVEGAVDLATSDNQGFMSNAGFVVTPAGVVVVDTLATPALAERLVQEIRARTTAPIVRVILTHFHADHAYGVRVFQDLGVAVEVHGSARRYLGSPESSLRLDQRREVLGPWLGASFELPRPDRWLETQERFELGGVSFELQHLGPSHAPDDLVVIVQPDGVAFTGDIAYDGRLPFLGEDADIDGWLAALDRLDALAVRTMVPGHGAAVIAPRPMIAATRRYLVYLRAAMLDAVTRFEPFDEAYAAADWAGFAELPTFGEANRLNAYNAYLQMEAASLRR